MKKSILFVGILFVFTASLVIFIHFDAVKIAYGCKSFKVDAVCMVDQVESFIDSEPEGAGVVLSQMASLRRLSLLGGDFRTYSISLHRLGHAFFKEGYDYGDLEEICPPLIKDGCVHGYVMQYISQNSMEDGIELCRATLNARIKLGCVHALGHSYLEHNHQSVQEANQSLCKQYSNLEQTACFSGLFHEDSKFGKGVGHERYYQRSQAYNEISCDDFDGEEYAICYGAKGSFRQYFPESESLKATDQLCNEANTQEAKELCKYSARQRLDIARGYSFVHFK